MAQLNIPYQFIAGTKAKASEVNANFNAIVNEVDAIYAQILNNSNSTTASLSAMSTTINELTNEMNDFIDTYTVCTKFCVNNAKLNSSNVENVLSANSNVISFNVDSDTPLVATNFKGKTFSLENIEDLTLPALSDGTYTVYVDKDGNVDYYTSTVQYVSSLPTNPYVNEVCFLMGEEPFKVYKYSGVEWTEFLSVPVGEFVITDSEIQSISTYPYNQNGYNVNLKSFTSDFTNNGWVKMPNGLIFQWGHYSFSANQVINFPIAFPNACFSIAVGSNPNNLGASAHVNITVQSKSQFKVAAGMYQSGASGGDTYLIAVGY